MRKKKYISLDELYQDLTPNQLSIVQSLEPLFEGVAAQQILQWNSIVRKFPNGRWCYFNHYQRARPVLGFSGGASMVKDRPVLVGFFDEVKKSVGKVILDDVATVERKGVASMIQYVATL